MSFLCKFCGVSLSTKSNLAAHQKKTIKCLEIQYAGAKTVKELEDERKFKCDDCGLKFSIKTNLQRHQESCSSKNIAQVNRELIDELKRINSELSIKLEMSQEQIKKLEDQLAKERQNQQHVTLAAISKPTTSTTTSVKT